MARSQSVSGFVLFVYLFICFNLLNEYRAEEVVAGTSPVSLISDADRQNLRALLPRLNQLARLKAIETGMKHDDDHSNIDLDKLNEIHRYEILPVVSDTVRDSEDSANSLNRLFSKMLRANSLVRDQSDKKRSVRQLAALKEDKDYSFVGLPILMNKLSAQQQLQRATQKLRDIFMTKGSLYRLSNGNENNAMNNNNNNNFDELSQVNFRPFNDASNDKNEANINDLMPKNRDKRRRCKVEPNLGVKNPSSCDTDAYFGAADYSMRDVWDSAGRR